MKGIEVPDLTEDFTADAVELFFDLAYVFAFSQLVGLLINDPTWTGVGTAALLFLILWLPWQQLTWAANAVSGNGRPIRMIFLAATVVSVPMAAATSTALTTGGLVFAISLAGIMFLGFGIQILGIESGTNFAASVARWIAPNVVAVGVLVAGGFFDGRTRVILWVVSMLIVIVAMIRAGSGEWIIRIGHMAERHALIVIIALGEIVVAIGIPVVAALQDADGFGIATVAALVASGAFAGLLWWAYFDRPGPGLEHRGNQLTDHNERGRYVRDVYTWAHLPIVAGIVLSAAALEEIALHPLDHVELSFRLMLGGGLALSVFGVSMAVWRAFRAFPFERILATIAIATLVAFGASINGLTLLTIVVITIFFFLVIEHQRVDAITHPALESG